MSDLLYQQIEDVIEAWHEAHPNPRGYVELVRAVHDFTSKAIAAVVQAERERCAKVARGFKTGDGNAIAAAIEGGDDEAEPRNPGK